MKYRRGDLFQIIAPGLYRSDEELAVIAVGVTRIYVMSYNTGDLRRCFYIHHDYMKTVSTVALGEMTQLQQLILLPTETNWPQLDSP